MSGVVLLAYVNIFSFAHEMSKNEFSSQVEYSDRYVARHSIIIRGVNRKIGTEEAAKKIGKIFESRFLKN
jgi:hypothetical protein